MLFRLANKTANKYPINCVACGLSVSLRSSSVDLWCHGMITRENWFVGRLFCRHLIHLSSSSPESTSVFTLHWRQCAITPTIPLPLGRNTLSCPVQMPSASVTKGANRAEIKCTVSARVAELNHRNRFGDDKIRYWYLLHFYPGEKTK